MNRCQIILALGAFMLLPRVTVFAADDAAPSVSVFADDVPPAISVFFTPEETKQIEALNRNMPNAQKDIHLGAVMYYGPGNWTLWLQGVRWTPETQQADLHILDVTPDQVRLSYAATPDTPPHEITLRPNQTYRIATDEIIEGEP